MAIKGTGGNDSLSGTTGDDLFKLFQGGDDEAIGMAGNDEFRLGATFNAADSIRGGDGDDVLVLDGNYAAGVVFGATTMLRVETMILRGFTYDLTLDDANVAADAVLTVDGSALSAASPIIFDGSAETDGRFAITAGFGDDNLTGGASKDKFILKSGGNDTANGGGGKDTFLVGDKLNSADVINGGTGNDTLNIGGSLDTQVTLNATTLTGVERIVVGNDVGVAIVSNNATVAAGATLVVDASAVHVSSFSFAGQAETDGHFDIFGGGSAGTLTGGALDDNIQAASHTGLYTLLGRGGADTIGCNGGADRVRMLLVGDSASTAHDTVTSFNADQDTFDTSTTVTSVLSTSGSVSNATFDADLGNVIADSLAPGRAMIVTVTGGDLINHALLVIDGNGTADYNANSDYVVDITGFNGTLDTTDFI